MLYSHVYVLAALMITIACMAPNVGFPIECIQFITTGREIKSIVSTMPLEAKLDKIDPAEIHSNADKVVRRGLSSKRRSVEEKGPAMDELASIFYHKRNLERVTLSIDGPKHGPGTLKKNKWTEIMLSNARGATAREKGKKKTNTGNKQFRNP